MGDKCHIPEISRYRRLIERVFDVEDVLHQQIGSNTIVKYYQQSALFYRLFHSIDDSIHLALNPQGRFDKSGYYGQDRIIEEFIRGQVGERVLELACGKGFNLKYLAARHPQVRFTGIDLTPEHVAAARKKTTNYPNVKIVRGDFHNLPFGNGEFDLVYVIESLCHSDDMGQALTEACRVLRPAGKLIVFDGYKIMSDEDMDEDTRTVSRIAEISLALPDLMTISDWIELAKSTGFVLYELDDLTQEVMPNVLRFQTMARWLFRYPKLGRIGIKILPELAIRNIISGLLMPVVGRCGVQGYYEVVLTKPGIGHNQQGQ